ncbi:GNAT family N-acetyltransferase [Shimia sp. SDUM112013]|uniref:GNAT family N-acetyltransferase n=1 Tax=Shimia sp. SDUM112013 TaxID=3136160 RepID=UPI0032EF1CBB
MTPETLARIHQAAFTISRGWQSGEFRDLLDSPFCFVVGDDAGFALGREIAGEAELLTIAVHPDHQGQGLGAKWLAAFHDIARARGADMAFLEVADDNHAAIHLYLSAGYRDQSRRKGYYKRPAGPPVDARILSRPLT